LDTLVSQAFGAGKVEDCHHSLLNGIYLSFAITPVLMAANWWLIPFLRRVGVDPNVLQAAIIYTRALGWGTLPLLLYFAVRRTLQAMNMVKAVAFALVTANIVNAFGNWILIYGKFGAPRMGLVGSAWSTCIARVYLASVLVGYLLWYDWRHRTELLKTPVQPDLRRIGRLITLGFPTAMQITMEIGVFAFATALIGKLGPIALASHQIALNTVSLTYMVPLGVSSAAAVRVGQALGRKDIAAAERSGWAGIFLGAAFMSAAAVILLLFPYQIARMYTPEQSVIRATATLLAFGAAFQLCDGVHTVATGALRGAGETRIPMLCHLLGYWAIGLPIGAFLCFRMGWGVPGLWSGLSLALILIGVVLLMVWKREIQDLQIKA
jgi:MATE family multidrug resistance protein